MARPRRHAPREDGAAAVDRRVGVGPPGVVRGDGDNVGGLARPTLRVGQPARSPPRGAVARPVQRQGGPPRGRHAREALASRVRTISGWSQGVNTTVVRVRVRSMATMCSALSANERWLCNRCGQRVPLRGAPAVGRRGPPHIRRLGAPWRACGARRPSWAGRASASHGPKRTRGACPRKARCGSATRGSTAGCGRYGWRRAPVTGNGVLGRRAPSGPPTSGTCCSMPWGRARGGTHARACAACLRAA